MKLWVGTRSDPLRALGNSPVGLLPLLEVPWPRAALQDLELGLGVRLADVVNFALQSGSDYWAGAALGWLEEGFDEDVRTDLLVQLADRRWAGQRTRHRARGLADLLDGRDSGPGL